MKPLNITALALIIVGGINWGLVGLFGYNFLDGLVGAGSSSARAIYIIIGLAALWSITGLFMTMGMTNTGKGKK